VLILSEQRAGASVGGSHGALVPPEQEIVLLLALAMTRYSRWCSGESSGLNSTCSSQRNRTARKLDWHVVKAAMRTELVLSEQRLFEMATIMTSLQFQ
jgi:hypothetical protein